MKKYDEKCGILKVYWKYCDNEDDERNFQTGKTYYGTKKVFENRNKSK